MSAPPAQPESPGESQCAISVSLHDRWLVVSFASPVRACSWAIVGGGLVDAAHVAWLEVRNDELRPPVDAAELLRERLAERKLQNAVGLLTSCRLSGYRDVSLSSADLRVRCIATVGLGNALRAGDPAAVADRLGTINILLHVDAPLADVALLEACAIVTEAKTAAVLEAGILSRRSHRPATGTGTDCTVVAGSLPDAQSRSVSYAGKHTELGALIGTAVMRAVGEGVSAWLLKHQA
jgi:adenosylcobinamide amidohydrolase